MTRNKEGRACGVSDSASFWSCIFIFLWFCVTNLLNKVSVLIIVNRSFNKMVYNLQALNVYYRSKLSIVSRVTVPNHR